MKNMTLVFEDMLDPNKLYQRIIRRPKIAAVPMSDEFSDDMLCTQTSDRRDEVGQKIFTE